MDPFRYITHFTFQVIHITNGKGKKIYPRHESFYLLTWATFIWGTNPILSSFLIWELTIVKQRAANKYTLQTEISTLHLSTKCHNKRGKGELAAYNHMKMLPLCIKRQLPWSSNYTSKLFYWTTSVTADRWQTSNMHIRYIYI